MFANAQLARMAAEKELEEAQGRTLAQHALANARAQAAQRALVMAKEKASNEAKSEFMSLMCHEVGTDLLNHPCKLPVKQAPMSTLARVKCAWPGRGRPTLTLASPKGTNVQQRCCPEYVTESR